MMLTISFVQLKKWSGHRISEGDGTYYITDTHPAIQSIAPVANNCGKKGQGKPFRIT